MGLSCEGKMLGRDGTLCWLVLSTEDEVFMFDILGLGILPRPLGDPFTGSWNPAGLIMDDGTDMLVRRRAVQVQHGGTLMLATTGYITTEAEDASLRSLPWDVPHLFANIGDDLAADNEMIIGGWLQLVVETGCCVFTGLQLKGSTCCWMSGGRAVLPIPRHL